MKNNIDNLLECFFSTIVINGFTNTFTQSAGVILGYGLCEYTTAKINLLKFSWCIQTWPLAKMDREGK
jgi:hypothetical protein